MALLATQPYITTRIPAAVGPTSCSSRSPFLRAPRSAVPQGRPAMAAPSAAGGSTDPPSLLVFSGDSLSLRCNWWDLGGHAGGFQSVGIRGTGSSGARGAQPCGGHWSVMGRSVMRCDEACGLVGIIIRWVRRIARASLLYIGGIA